MNKEFLDLINKYLIIEVSDRSIYNGLYEVKIKTNTYKQKDSEEISVFVEENEINILLSFFKGGKYE